MVENTTIVNNSRPYMQLQVVGSNPTGSSKVCWALSINMIEGAFYDAWHYRNQIEGLCSVEFM